MNMKKTAALALAALLSLGVCGAQALTMTGLETELVERDWATSKFFARMETLTGVSVQAQGIEDEAEYAALLEAMCAGDVRTDALFKANLSREQERALLDSGAILDLAPLLEANMPNLCALLDAHPEWRAVIELEDGRIASLPLLNERERQAALWINRAWLEKLGLPMPQTLEELTDALLAIRDGDPNGNGKRDEIGADLIGVYEMRWLLPYFGIVADDYNLARDASGKIVFAPELPEYRAFIELLQDWYARGVLREDAFTALHGAQTLNERDDRAPAVSGMLLSMTPYTHLKADSVTEYETLLLPGPDGRTRWRDLLGGVWTGCFAVTSACEDPAEALRWADALYAQEGALLGYAGVEGEDYTVNDAGKWSFAVESGRDISAIRAQVLMYTGTAMPGLYPADFVHRVDSRVDQHVFAESEKVRAVSERVTQPYCLDAAAQAEADALNTTLGALVDTGIARFATGETELTDESYAAWLAQLKDAGSARLTELFQDAQ